MLSPRPFPSVVVLSATLAATGCAHRHPASGLVLAVEGQRMIVSHREIPGVMPAMAMPFTVAKPRELRALRPGDQIDFTLVRGKNESQARNVKRRATLGEGTTDGLTLQPPPETVALGQPMPDFTLTDQEGRQQSLSALRGSVVAVNFIYTRCPLPEVCPRLTSHFARLQRRFAGPVRFLTISLDPQYDTVTVLKDYARKWRADGSRWQLLTGTKDDAERIARRFGLLYWPEQGQLVHTSVTGVIDPQGRLAARIEGSSYDAAQLGDLIEKCVTSTAPSSR